ncbi:MAG: hypothetical protein U0800_08155 [Isosphaeraceae bacterium]
MESRPRPGEIPAPPLPEPGADLYVIHYSQRLALECTDGTPSVSAIVVQHFLTGQQTSFATLKHAEREAIPTSGIEEHLPRFEKALLEEFGTFLDRTGAANWLHWGMRTSRFGFEVLEQRAHRHGLQPPAIPADRRFDLANYLKRVYGRDYAPHPRLRNASIQNGTAGPGFLDEDKAAEAWHSGDHAALLWSLAAKVHSIARLFEIVHEGRFQTCAFRTPSVEEILSQLRSSGTKGKPMCAALVEFMNGRRSASAQEAAEHVHRDSHADDKAIRANVRRTNEALEGLGADFCFKFSAGHIHLVRPGAARPRSPGRDESVTDA